VCDLVLVLNQVQRRLHRGVPGRSKASLHANTQTPGQGAWRQNMLSEQDNRSHLAGREHQASCVQRRVPRRRETSLHTNKPTPQQVT
jgi:hypothetical protein